MKYNTKSSHFTYQFSNFCQFRLVLNKPLGMIHLAQVAYPSQQGGYKSSSVVAREGTPRAPVQQDFALEQHNPGGLGTQEMCTYTPCGNTDP